VRQKLETADPSRDKEATDKLYEKLAEIHNRLAWLALDDFAQEESQWHFEAGQNAARRVNAPAGTLRILCYHLRHGLGLVKRFRAEPPEEVVDHFTSLIQEMQTALANSDDFTPNQRLSVRLRMANSLERRADTVLFRSDPRPHAAAALMEEAYDFVAQQEQMQDDPGRITQARLLAKLAIAQALDKNVAASQAACELATKVTLPPNVQAKLAVWREAAIAFRQIQVPAEFEVGRKQLEQLAARDTGKKAAVTREEKELLLLAAATLRSLPSEPQNYRTEKELAERIRDYPGAKSPNPRRLPR
jgi:hypothetical protein